MAAVTIYSDFGAQKNSLTLFPLFPHLFSMKWWDRMPWSSFSECWVLSQLFHSPLSLSSSKRLFSSSSLSAIRVVSSAYPSLLIFLPAILIPACASSSHKREDLKLQTSWPLRTGLQEGLKSADLMYRGQKSQKLTCADPLRIDPDILLLKKRSRCTSVSFCHIIISWPMFKWTGTETKLLEDCPPWMSCVPVLCTEYTDLN